MSSNLDAQLKIRLATATKRELEELAHRLDRTPAALARRLIREGLEREATPKGGTR